MEDIVSGATGGLRWAVPAKVDHPDTLTERLVGGSRLPLEEILRARELAVGRAMIDIGANVGTTSIPRVVLGDFGWVYAIEPDPANYACLFNNVVVNGLRGLVLPDRVAVGDTNGEMTLRMQATGTHHLVTRASDVSDSERVTVPCLTLDTWVDRMGIDLADVAFIKSDTQGWDARVLAGASRVLSQKHIAWQIEFSPAMLERSGRSLDEVYALLQQHFTHFIDLRGESGAHVRPASELRTALAYVGKSRRKYTNVLLYSADSSRTS
jgi:FkbM family methyltransferase